MVPRYSWKPSFLFLWYSHLKLGKVRLSAGLVVELFAGNRIMCNNPRYDLVPFLPVPGPMVSAIERIASYAGLWKFPHDRR